MRFVIIGTSGSGKSTFGNALAQVLHCPFTDLDELFWGPNWTAVSHIEFENTVRAAADEEKWVVAGNYSAVRDILWLRATHIVWLNLNRRVILYRVLKRTIRRILLRIELWNGNKESIRSAFFSKDSVLLYSFTSFTENRRKFAVVRQESKYAHLQWIEISTSSQTKECIEKYSQTDNSFSSVS
jgi:adenylate kinase family enzyme